MQFSYMQVDAFTQKPFAGNACAVVFETDDLSTEQMQVIAKEFNLSETAFVSASDRADFRVRYFTPSEEIPLAGHPTIATSHALVASERFQLQAEITHLSLELQVGVIRVDLHRVDDRIGRVDMYQKKPSFGRIYDPAKVLPVFGLEEADLLEGAPIQTVSTGTPQLMIHLRDLASLRKARLDFAAYDRLKQEGDFFSPHLFCRQGMTPKGQTFARHFGTPPDILEDPFTGSATGGMAAYLWHYDYLNSPQFTAEQGHDMGRPGLAEVAVIGSREAIETVRVGGHGVMVMEGRIRF